MHQFEQSEIAISVLALARVPAAYPGGNITLVRTAFAPTCYVHGKTPKTISAIAAQLKIHRRIILIEDLEKLMEINDNHENHPNVMSLNFGSLQN